MKRSTSFALLLLVQVAVFSTCFASFSIRVGYTQEDLLNGIASPNTIDLWSFRDSTADSALSCLPSSSFWTFQVCEQQNCSRFTNRDLTGFNSTSDPSWEDVNNLPFLNRVPLACQFGGGGATTIGCTLPAPEPTALFECVGTEWRPKCPTTSTTCLLNADVVITNQTVGIQQNVEISGNLTNSGTGKIIVRVVPLTGSMPVGLNISGCAESTTPIVIDTSNIGTEIKNSTIVEYSSCGGTMLGTELAGQWDECQTGYTRSTQTVEDNGRLALLLIFTPVSPGQCNAGVVSTLPMMTIIGIAVGAAAAVIVALLIIVFAVPSIRTRLFPFMQRRDEDQNAVRMSTIQS